MCAPASVRCVDLTAMLVPSASMSASGSQPWAVEVGCRRLVWPTAPAMRTMLRNLGCAAPEAADFLLPEHYTSDTEPSASEAVAQPACAEEGIAMLVEAPLALWQAQSEATMLLAQCVVAPEASSASTDSAPGRMTSARAAALALSVAARLTTAIGRLAVALGAACVLVVEPAPASALASVYREWALSAGATVDALSSDGTSAASTLGAALPASSQHALPLRAVQCAHVSLPRTSLPAYAQHAVQASEVARTLPTTLDAQLHAPLMFYARGTAAHELQRMAQAYRHTALPSPLLVACTVTADEAVAQQMPALLHHAEHPISVLLACVAHAHEDGNESASRAPNARRRRVDEAATQLELAAIRDIRTDALALVARGVDLSRSLLRNLNELASL